MDADDSFRIRNEN